ncbi:phosphate-starvation-inducible PsiE family protein [Mycolicibacterium bacteremicum]|uniref:phosphate-starvation-inducible PsiE family protein n=1 Tax=Mycolicibacterium bacteremicum TaxID=564198 RepID=UPI001F18D2CF|nr:phosphate-starvation-inducible PsiE family protein [Mycolicibacterium bacteremicum]
MAEKDETHDEKDRQRFADRVLSIVEDAIYWAIAVILVAGAVALLVAQVKTMFSLLDTPTSNVMLEVLDGVLLIFIFVELLYAVRTSLRSHEIAVEPFLVVGILACIKEIVVQSVEAAKLVGQGPEFARTIVQTGVLGALVLVLAVAAWVLRQRRLAGPRTTGTPERHRPTECPSHSAGVAISARRRSQRDIAGTAWS